MVQCPTPRRPSARRAAWCGILLACLAPGAAQAAAVWTASASEKIRPAAPARAATSARISAARNEFEPFQVVVTGPATGVRATATALAGPATLPAPRLFRVALIDLKNASALDGGTGRWPDALVPAVDETAGEPRNAFPFDVPAGESRAIWVEVRVPQGAPAGAYGGAVKVTWSGGEATVPVSLTVHPFTLPSRASLKSAFGFTWGAIPSGHGLGYGDAFKRLRARYGQLALDHRISLSQIDDGDTSLTSFTSWYGPSIDGTAPTELPGARLTSVELMGNASTWSTHFKSKGWFDRLFQYTCDEPPLTCAWADIPVRARAAKAADPALRTLVTTTIQEADQHRVTSSIDILVPVVNYLDDRPGSQFSGPQRAKYDAFLAASPLRELWTYQSCMSHGCGGTVNFGSPSYSDRHFTGWPTYVIDSTAVRNRAMQWISFRHRVTGELYYETAMAYSHDPWNNQWDFSGNGDGTLFYPGTPAKIGGITHVPVASIRLKMIREGMEDYEYLRLLSDLGDAALAHQIATELFPNAYSTEIPFERLLAARERLAARIVELSAPGWPAPLPGPAPAPAPEPHPGPTAPSDPGPLPIPGAPDPASPPESGAGGPQGGCNGGAGGLTALGALALGLALRRVFRR